MLYKNNTDGKGASYGTHENYLMDRRVPFRSVVDVMTAFLVTRQIYTGSGRVGLGQDGRVAGYQLSSRADFFETEVGLETTLKRPIINTRDEPHADPALWRRLHVIVGDANLSETATLLKLGATAIGPADARGRRRPGDPAGQPRRGDAPGLPRPDPGRAAGAASAARPMTALQIQWCYLAAARQFVAELVGPAHQGAARPLGRGARAAAADRTQLADRLDWLAKLTILDGYRQRDGLDWSAHRLAAVDLQYADTRPERGLAFRLEQRGSLRRLTTDAAGGGRHGHAAAGHPRLVPRGVRPPLRRPGGRRLVGLGHLRRARDAARWCASRPRIRCAELASTCPRSWIGWAASGSSSPP